MHHIRRRHPLPAQTRLLHATVTQAHTSRDIVHSLRTLVQSSHRTCAQLTELLLRLPQSELHETMESVSKALLVSPARRRSALTPPRGSPTPPLSDSPVSPVPKPPATLAAHPTTVDLLELEHELLTLNNGRRYLSRRELKWLRGGRGPLDATTQRLKEVFEAWLPLKYVLHHDDCHVQDMYGHGIADEDLYTRLGMNWELDIYNRVLAPPGGFSSPGRPAPKHTPSSQVSRAPDTTVNPPIKEESDDDVKRTLF